MMVQRAAARLLEEEKDVLSFVTTTTQNLHQK
jgi:hypothetical protein